MDNLKGRTLSGLFWNLSQRVGLQIVQFIPIMILARLLAPEEFGLVGMLALFMALAGTFLDSGFGQALIQKKDATFVDECSIFYFNIFIGLIFVLILYFAAPLIADFYHQPLLTGLTRWMSLKVLINSFSLIQTTQLVRKLDFKTQFKSNLIASLLSGLVGICAAYLGLGVWSLVIDSIAAALLVTVTLWLMSDWRPALVFSLDSLKTMFGFGSRLLMSSLIGTFFDNLYQAFIGKAFSAATLGLYMRADSIKAVMIDVTSNTVGGVMFPVFASIQDDLPRLKRACRKSIILSTSVHFPMMIGLIVVAGPLINVLFSAKWDSCALFLQLMCVAGLLYPLHLINLDIIKVKGRSDLTFRLEVIKRCLAVLFIFVTYRWGISAILIGQIVLSMIGFFLNSYYSARMIGYPARSQILDVLPAFLLSCLMGVVALLVGYILRSSNTFLLLAAQIATGAGLYFLLHWIFKTESAKELLELVKRLPLLAANKK